MNSLPLNFKEANRNIGWVLLVGIALGIANYSLGAWPTLGQSLVQQIVMSLVIGYSLLVLVSNAKLFLDKKNPLLQYTILFSLFALIGFIGTEIEFVVRAFLFQDGDYQFLSGGGIYLFNCILSSIIGHWTYRWYEEKNKPKEIVPTIIPEASKETIQNVPIKKGEIITLFDIENIIYFEAYDNYSFLYDIDGNKHLCNYSLAYLEKKLDSNFVRVHRKYILHKNQIAKIQPHLKGRFVIEFKDKKQSSIISSTSYTDVIKEIIKL